MTERSHNYIFLDVDGVLNEHCELPLIYECLANLASVVKATKANVIVSSSWRDFPDMMEILVEAFRKFDIEYCGTTEPNHSKGWDIDRQVPRRPQGRDQEVRSHRRRLHAEVLLRGSFRLVLLHVRRGREEQDIGFAGSDTVNEG